MDRLAAIRMFVRVVQSGSFSAVAREALVPATLCTAKETLKDPPRVFVETAIRQRLTEAPSFVAFEGYDTVAVLADVLRSHGEDWARTAESWPRVAVEGTRGQIQFSRTPGISVWQWACTPIQVVDRDPAEPDRFRILHAS